MWVHTDYMDYSPLGSMLAEVDAVYWALGTSAVNVSDEEYSQIHVDFSVRFVAAWLAARGRETPLSFHLVSGSGASEQSWFHWAREKARTERTLVHDAAGTGLRVVSYRPAGVLCEGERAQWYTAPFWLLRPLKRAIEPTAIDEAMLEVTARGSDPPDPPHPPSRPFAVVTSRVVAVTLPTLRTHPPDRVHLQVVDAVALGRIQNRYCKYWDCSFD